MALRPDCIPESTALTLLRMEVVAAQGMLRAVWDLVTGIILAPLIAIHLTLACYLEREGNWFSRMGGIPLWLSLGVAFAAVRPFIVFHADAVLTIDMVRREWTERWRYGKFKTPEGEIADIPDLVAEEAEKAAIAESVIRDYNAEAIRHGQGFG